MVQYRVSIFTFFLAGFMLCFLLQLCVSLAATHTHNINLLDLSDINVDIYEATCQANLCNALGKDDAVPLVTDIKVFFIDRLLAASWLILLWFLTLRVEMPSADSCGDPFQTEDFFPIGCGAEAVFNFSLEKEILPDGSGDDNDDEDFVTYVRTTPSTKRTSWSHRTTSPPVKITAVVPFTPNKNAPRLPPRFTPSPEIRHSSFQHLLRIHLSSFNQRLSMLESNTLDMKEGIRTLQKQQSFLSAQMKQLLALQSTGEKSQKVAELEQSYTNMEDRLSRLEGRLEILIDGFTALAQEMNKMKRRHISRSLQEKKMLPALTTTVVPEFYFTTQDLTTVSSTTKRSTPPKSIATTAKQRKNTISGKDTNGKASTVKKPATTRPPKSNVSTKSKVKSTTTTTTAAVPATRTKVKDQAKKAVSGRNPTAKTVSRPLPRKQGKEVTKFQLDPPSHSSRLLQSRKQSNKKDNKEDSRLLVKNNGHSKKAVRSDAAETQQRAVQNNLDKAKKVNRQHGKAAHKLVSKGSEKNTASKKRSSMDRATTPRPKRTTTPAPPPKTKTRASSVVKRKSNPAPKPPRKESRNPGSFDLLRLLNGDQRNSKQKTSQDASLHVVLGRLAIPIKIIPDD